MNDEEKRNLMESLKSDMATKTEALKVAERKAAEKKTGDDEDKQRLERTMGSGGITINGQSLGSRLADSEVRDGVDLRTPESAVIGKRTDYNHK
ncbi:hypothetical protein D4S03_02370 [bacterium]|nr:MAG: hypothetical protein D4S03_02370 [bacterium]